jgi:hypothetical protein
MSKLLLAFSAAAAIVAGAMAGPAAALTIDPSAVRAGTQALGSIDKAYCYGYGCRRYYYGYRPYYYGYRPYYYGYRY